MQEYLDKIAELKDDTKGINSLRETTKLFVEFLEKPEEVAQLLAKRGGDLGHLGEGLVLGLSSKLSRPVAIEKGKKALLFHMASKLSYLESLYDYVNNEIKNSEDKIDQTYKLVSITNQQDLFQRKAQYNQDPLTKEYMIKQLHVVVSERASIAQTELDATTLLQRIFATLERIGSISLSELEQAIIRHTNNYDLIDKTFKSYLGADTMPQVVLEDLDIPRPPVLNGEKQYLEYINTQQATTAEDELPTLDHIVDAMPNAAKRLYQAVTAFKELIDQLAKRFEKGQKAFKDLNEMYKQKIEEFTKEPVTPVAINNVTTSFTTLLKNYVIADSNALEMVHKYGHIVVNHILLYIYMGDLLDLILVSGTIGKDGRNPYAIKQQKKAAIIEKMGNLNTVDLLKAEGKATPPEEPAKAEDGTVEETPKEQ